jgi:myo-inositol-1-phosphate synthase
MSQKIKVAVVGVGNCLSSLYQGLHFYKDHDDSESIPGVMFSNVGGYNIGDIEIVAAFDVDIRKVGKSLGEAIFAKPNCARIFHPVVEPGPVVNMGPVFDGVSNYMETQPERYGFRVSTDNVCDVDSVLKGSGAEILINYLPVGSQEATEWWASKCIEHKISFLNCIPVLTVNHPEWESKFINAGIPYVGSDMKSQFGSSVLSQILQELAFSRGMSVDYHQQINVGGNTDFNNMMVQDRLKHKKVSKENVIRAQNDIRGIPVEEDALFAGPSTFIPYLKDNKIAYLNLHLRGFGDAPVTVDIKLSVHDSENSSGVVIDALRYLKVARELGIIGCLRGPSAFTQKSPPKQLTYDLSLSECEALAHRQLTDITKRQLTVRSAIEFAWEEYNSGGMDYLRLVGM